MIPGDIDDAPGLSPIKSEMREDANVRRWAPAISSKGSIVSLRLICCMMLQQDICRTSLNQLMSILVYIRGSRPMWVNQLPEVVRRKRSLKQISENEFLVAWAKSDNFFKAPRYWPARIMGAFRWRLIPSPQEIGAITMNRHPYMVRSAMLPHIILLAYCHGIPVEGISKSTGLSEDMIYDRMYQAIMRLFTLPSFVVWATGTNFRKATLLPGMLEALGENHARRENLTKLNTSPFRFERRFLTPWVESPGIRTYLIYGTPKKPRLSGRYYDRNLAEARS